MRRIRKFLLCNDGYNPLIWNYVLLLILGLVGSLVESIGHQTISPRVVHTKQTNFQGYLGPVTGDGHARSGYGTDGSYSYPYNYRGGYGHGQPLVETFKGIPYASPPTGSLRYDSPTPFTLRSNEVYVANKTKPPCPRFFDSSMNRTFYSPDPIRTLKHFQLTAPLEDCLYLDIYAPLNTHKNSGPGLPVLVFANSQPDEPEDPFDGSSVAAIGQIIVVSFRYRVGVLGFLQPGYSEDVRSNFGLWDQLAALQWIRENIGAFGGDENNVCLMGYDLDASISGILALSPLAQAYGGLFSRLILLNGSPFSPISINQRPLEATVQLARALQCSLLERDGELMSCLRRRPLEQVMAAGQTIGSSILSYPFAPSVDGTIVRTEMADLSPFSGESEAIKEVLGRYDVMAGLGQGPVLPNIGKPFWQNIDLHKFAKAAIKLVMKMEPGSEPTESLVEDFKRALKNQYGEPPLMRDIISDFLLINPMINFLNTHAQTGRNTFLYVSKDYDPLHKAKHNEVSYIFSNKIYKWKYVDLGQPNMDLQPFELMILFISNFVRSGDPNVQDPSVRVSNPGKSWPKYRRDPGRFLKFGLDVEVQSKYRRSQTMFWTHVFPEILRPYTSSVNSDSLNQFNNQWLASPDTNSNKFPGHFGKGRGPGRGSFPNHIYPVESLEEPSQTLSSMTQSTVVIVGAILLLLNLLCFMGLFYQRERLKKAEVLFRKRAAEPQDGTREEEEEPRGPATELDSILSEPYVPRPAQPLRAPLDTLSETETDNGFGPDFLGPNYDPRTKVSRWMFQQQNRDRDDRSEDPVYHPVEVEAEVIVQNRGTSPPPYPGPGPPPMEFLPPLPYRDPFRPSIPISDIPYADSRATSPSVSNPAHHTPPPAFNNNLSNSNFNYNGRRVAVSPTNSSTASSTGPRRTRGKVVIPLRNSVIIREMDSDDEVESSEPKLVPIKTGTLTRSVAVGSNNNENENGTRPVLSRGGHHGSGQKVTFADEIL